MDLTPVLLEAIDERQATILANLLELYCHDLSAEFELDIGPDGRFGYPRLVSYWTEPQRNRAFLIRVGSQICGFVLVTRGCPLTSDPTDLDVAEFFVLRRYRRSNVATRAASALWDRMPGHWVVRVAECNTSAMPFWASVVPEYTRGQFTRRQASLAGRRWIVFEFDSPRHGR